MTTRLHVVSELVDGRLYVDAAGVLDWLRAVEAHLAGNPRLPACPPAMVASCLGDIWRDDYLTATSPIRASEGDPE